MYFNLYRKIFKPVQRDFRTMSILLQHRALEDGGGPEEIRPSCCSRAQNVYA